MLHFRRGADSWSVKQGIFLEENPPVYRQKSSTGDTIRRGGTVCLHPRRSESVCGGEQELRPVCLRLPGQSRAGHGEMRGCSNQVRRGSRGRQIQPRLPGDGLLV